MTTREAEPWTPPFTVYQSDEGHFRVIDANDHGASPGFVDRYYAQTLCDRLNAIQQHAPASPAMDGDGLEELAFQAFWAWTRHPNEGYARKAWKRMLEGEPFKPDDERYDPENPGKLWYAPDMQSHDAWLRVAQKLAGITRPPHPQVADQQEGGVLTDDERKTIGEIVEYSYDDHAAPGRQTYRDDTERLIAIINRLTGSQP